MKSSPESLIRQAFEMARQKGKPDWQRMTIPVLKNRILQLTKGAFQESDYGARSMREFVTSAGPEFRLDESSNTPAVEFMHADTFKDSGEPYASTTTAAGRVRPDLWKAAIDYASGIQYVWDPVHGARPQTPGETLPILPTVSKTEMDAWRTEFAENLPGLDADQRNQLKNWATSALPTRLLPADQAQHWNVELTKRTESRLRDWFSEQAIPPPPDLVGVRLGQRPAKVREVESLRRFISECVAVMTEQELKNISLSPVSMLRALKRSGGTEKP